nr:phage portal protein [Agrobacterium vitis]
MAEDTTQISAQVFQLVADCEKYRDELSKDRVTATEYHDGVMKDTPAEDNRSKVVSRDVRSACKKVKPSLIRTILGGEKVVEYQPVNEGDEQGADQATDYVNFVIMPESGGYDAIEDAADDAIKLRNGFIRWWYDTRRTVEVSTHTGLDEAALVQLVSDDSVTVLEQQQYEEQIQTPEGLVMQPSYDVKIRRESKKGIVRVKAVPPENMLIHPDALDLDESPIVGINERMRRSDLVAMGYDRDKIDNLPTVANDINQEAEENTRRREPFDRNDALAKANQEVDYYELYVRIDADDDGIAELRRMVYAGGIADRYLLDDEECDDVPFADLVVERRAHQREGNSIPDDLMEIQRIKTVLLRQTLDNVYWQNNPQPVVQEGVISNPESVLNPKFGEPIRVSNGVNIRDALGFNPVPFVAAQSFQMLGYMDQEAQDRTGINDASGGLPPDALQNVTAKASALIESAGIAQTEQMVRTFAQGLKCVFRGVLRTIIKHQDRPRTVRLRKQWVTFDPRQWNAGMDCTVNTGLGAGTRERDMQMMLFIGQQQEKLLSAYGPVNNPYVSPDNVWNSVSKGVEAAGLKNPRLYFTEPSPETIQKMQQAAQSKPDPAMEKVKAQIEADKAKLQAAAQQSQIDAQLEQKRMQQEFDLKRYQIDQEIALKRQQNAAQVLTGQHVAAAHIGGAPG